MVVVSLLKQLIYSTDTIPSQVITMYNEAKKEYPRPNLSAFVDVLITCAKLAPFVILFDGFDESDQRGIVWSKLIRPMYNSGIKVFITHRPHILQKSEIDFEEFTVMEIRAQDEDIEKYISQQLEVEEKTKRLHQAFKARIIKEIKHQAKEMYNSFYLPLIQVPSCPFPIETFALRNRATEYGKSSENLAK